MNYKAMWGELKVESNENPFHYSESCSPTVKYLMGCIEKKYLKKGEKIEKMLTHKDIIVNDLWNKLDSLREKIKLATKSKFTFPQDFKELKELLLKLKEN